MPERVELARPPAGALATYELTLARRFSAESIAADLSSFAYTVDLRHTLAMAHKDVFRVVDPAALPKHFDAPSVETRLDAQWQESGIYTYNSDRGREETFAVDTPPPTVSGSLHVGHVFSYTHTDIIVRQRRMRGQNIFYPMGWDDNGLPTERRVQNLFHVRCDPFFTEPTDIEAIEPASAKMRKERPRSVSRSDFIKLCSRVTLEDERAFTELFRRVGLSVDWNEEYATIGERARKLAQLSFLDLFEKGHVYNQEAPTMWDVDFQTAVAQAEVEDRPTPGAYHKLAFELPASGEEFLIATTRPELLPACVGVTAHPDDARYQALFGQHARTPLFHVDVPIFPSELADPKKGTGIVMVCTFGDANDVEWWRKQKLALRQIVGRDGRLLPVNFGSDAFPSSDATAANESYADLQGKTLKSARGRIVELLAQTDGGEPPLRGKPQSIEHPVKYFEKGDRPLEMITTRQWFVRLVKQKEALLQQGDAIKWHPDFMRLRYRNWTENLQLDWCISRQRFFGVPFPVWYPLDTQGEVDYAHPILAEEEALPLDPMTSTPAGYQESQRNQPNGFVGESDVFDTWFTSSLTPQIGSGWILDRERHDKLFPADIRPQSHEIIRTWAFYTIAKALLHESKVPWRHVVVSGWILDPDRKKMSKSKGNVITPLHLIDAYTADGVRYWAASARLGMDTAFDEKVLKLGRRLVTKIYNAGKFVLSQDGRPGEVTAELDRGFLAALRALVERVDRHYEAFDFAHAFMDIESFFWQQFTDSYLELVKARARSGSDPVASESVGRNSAVTTLRLGLDILLRLFAPVLPYVTEEVWSWAFAEEKNQPSIHRAPWPSLKELEDIPSPRFAHAFTQAAACLTSINKFKSEAGASVGRSLKDLVISCHQDELPALDAVFDDITSAARGQDAELVHSSELEPGAYQVSAEVLPKAV